MFLHFYSDFNKYVRYTLGTTVLSSIGPLRRRSTDCQLVKRRGRTDLSWKSDPRLKVRQGRAKMERK